MIFSASLADFQKLLQKVLPAIPPKSTLPVLEHIHFTLEENSLRVIATDQDITIMSVMEVAAEQGGSVLVPARKINDIIKVLDHNGQISFTADMDSFEIKIKAGKGTYKLKGLDPEEYLALPELFESAKPDITNLENTSEEFRAVFTKDELQKLASKTVFAVSTDEFRPAMTGVLFQFRKSYVNAVSTDSFRLVRATVVSEQAALPDGTDIILPARTIDQLKRIDDDTIMSLVEAQGKITHVRFDFGNTVFISRIIDEKFPPYEAVIPTGNDIHVLVDQREFLSAVKRVAIFANTHSKQVKMKLEDNLLTMTAEDDDSGYAGTEEVSCDYSHEPMEIGFNFKYLEDAVQNIDSSETENNLIVLQFSEANKPALIVPKSDKELLLMLIMPVRL